jgi:hypothetical protein
MLLVLLPVTVLLAFTAFGAVDQWKEARTLRDFRTATQVSFQAAGVSDAVARERIAAVLARLRPGPDTLRERSAAEGATDRALDRAADHAASWSGQPDVAGLIDAVSRQLHALRVQTGTGSLTARHIVSEYEDIEDRLLATCAALESGRPSRASGRAADAHIALLGAIEAGERERAETAILLDAPAERPAAADRWSSLEEAQLDTFRQNTSDALRSELYVTQFQPPGRAVRELRDTLATRDARAADLPSYSSWLTDSKARIQALRGIQHRAARELADQADHDLDTVQTHGVRDLALSLAVLVAVTVLALALRRSIPAPSGRSPREPVPSRAATFRTTSRTTDATRSAPSPRPSANFT